MKKRIDGGRSVVVVVVVVGVVGVVVRGSQIFDSIVHTIVDLKWCGDSKSKGKEVLGRV